MSLLKKILNDGWEGDTSTIPYTLTIGDPELPNSTWAKLIAYGNDYGSNVDIFYCENDNAGNTEVVTPIFKGLILDDVFLDDLYEALLLIEPNNELHDFDPTLN